MADRTVHGWTNDGREIVRYDRAGKWYIESTNPKALIPRQQVTLGQAVALATKDGAGAVIGRPGGGAFDAAVRRTGQA